MDAQRTGARNALTALLRTLDPGIDARSPLTPAQVARAEARRLASAVIAPGAELEANQRALAERVDRMVPGVLDSTGWAM